MRPAEDKDDDEAGAETESRAFRADGLLCSYEQGRGPAQLTPRHRWADQAAGSAQLRLTDGREPLFEVEVLDAPAPAASSEAAS